MFLSFCYVCLFFMTHLICHEAIHSLTHSLTQSLTRSLCSTHSVPPRPCNIYITLVLQRLLIIFQCERLSTGSTSERSVAGPAPSSAVRNRHYHGWRNLISRTFFFVYYFPIIYLYEAINVHIYLSLLWGGGRKGERHQLCVGGSLRFIP